VSTILDALRKVEREREPAAESAVGPAISSEVRRRRKIPVGAIVACALVGFSGGALLSWWSPSEEPVEVASLPPPPPPPDIAVPRAPLRAQPKAPAAAANAEEKKADVPSAAMPPATVAAPPAVPGSGVAPPPAAAPAEPPARPAEVAPSTAVAEAPAPGAAEAARPVEQRGSGEQLAALDKQGSALEPSPFGAAREAAAPNAPKTAPAVAPPAAMPPAPAVPTRPREDVAAIAPAEPEAPALDAVPEPEAEPEPEAPAETLFDTGRSPPGAPKVALSFLQWSNDPARRFAFISIDGAPTQRVHEGEVAAGLTVAAITPTGVQFKREGTTFVIRPRH
jgi:hypothetical protein